jgi:hypothetical protein
VEHGAVSHGAAQVSAVAAVSELHHMQTQDAACVVKAHGVVVAEGVALAGDDEVVITVEAHLDGALEFVGRHGSPHRQVSGLGFFTAKAATHAAAHHAHRMQRNVQRMRYPVLHFAGVLGAAVNQPLTAVLRNGVGDLAF